MKYDKKAKQARNLDNAVKSSQRDAWKAASERAYNFFLGNQLTTEEKQALEDKKMPTFIVNKITPQIELMKYFLTARNPRWQAVGADETDSSQAEIHAKVAQYVWTISKGQTIFSQVVEDCLSKSLGYIEIGVDPDMDEGLGEVIVQSENPWDVKVDPHSRDPFMRDASYILVTKDITIEKALIDFPQLSEQEVMKMADNDREMPMENWNNPVPSGPYEVDDDHDSEGKSNQFIKYYKLYEKKRIPYVNVYVKVENEIENYVMLKEQWDNIKKQEKDLPEEEKVFTGTRFIEEVMFYKKKVFKSESIGMKDLEVEVPIPGENYPIIPLPYRHNGNPYPASVAMDLVGKQEEINKAHQIMIHHANLSSSPRWLAEQGQITDVSSFERKSSTPGAVLTYNPGMDGSAPQSIQPLPLNSAFYTITQQGAQDMEYISGMSHYMMGQGDRSGREPYRGLLAQDDFGTRRVRGFATNVLNPFMGLVGQVIDDFARDLYQAQKVIHIANPDDPELIERHVVNEITGEDVENFFNEQTTRYNIIFVGGSTLLVNRWAELEQMLDLYQQGIVDKTSVLMKTDIGNKKAIMQKMDELTQLSSQLTQAQEHIDNLEKNNEILERQVINTRISAKVAEADIDINAEKEAFIMKLKSILQDAGNSAERKRIEIEKLIGELENEIVEKKESNQTGTED